MKKINFLLFFLLLLVACSGEERLQDEQGEQAGDSSQEGDQQQEDEVNQTAKPTESVITYPLTGMEADGQVNRRAVAVMVNNHRAARPQSGLSRADIVFEILAEGNITRLMAIFQSEKPSVVGPVRSAREYYFRLASGYEALYVYHGAADFIEKQLRNGVVDNLNGSYYDNDGYLFERVNFRVAPHNSYLQYGVVYEEAENQGYSVTTNHRSLPFLTTESLSEISGEPAAEVILYYDSTPVRYVYHPASEKYLRYNGDVQTIELNTEEPIQLDNLFIIEAHHEIIDEQGRRSIDLQSGGQAYLMRKGKLQKLQWENRDGKIIPVQDDKPVGFVPGKTWINVIPENRGLSEITIH